jgi:nicotinamidase-related amidase
MILSLLTAVLLTPPAVAGDGHSAGIVKGKPALVVMDMQNAYIPYMDQENKDLAFRVVNAAIAMFREQGLPIVVVYHTDPEHGPPQGSEGFEFPQELQIKDDDLKVVKNYPSAFKKTELEQILEDQGCDTVFLCGLSATGCVLATYYDAVGLELDTFMIRNGLMSHSHELTQSVEEITGAVGYQALKYMVANAPR